MVHVAVPAIA